MSNTQQQHAGAGTIRQFGEALGVSRFTVHRLIASGEIRSIKIGKARRIPWSELSRLLERDEVSTSRDVA